MKTRPATASIANSNERMGTVQRPSSGEVELRAFSSSVMWMRRCWEPQTFGSHKKLQVSERLNDRVYWGASSEEFMKPLFLLA
jgi:hypothetical protein